MSLANIGIPLDPAHLLQAAAFHFGIVRDVKDPSGRGRVRVEVPSLLGTGKDNWSNWAEVLGVPVGSAEEKDDSGFWWPMVPGQAVFMSFIAGDYFQPFVVPGPVWQEEEGEKKAMMPREARVVMKKKDVRESTRVRQLKSEAGHTLLMDDRGESELLAFVDWTGSGFFSIVPGKIKDEKEEDEQQSKPRKGERRKNKSVFAQTSKKPSEILKTKEQISGIQDMNGQGFLSVAKDDEGIVSFFSAKKNGEVGPSIILDSAEDRIILTAGQTQMQILGKEGLIRVTRQIIKVIDEIIDPVKYIKGIKKTTKERFSEYDE